MTVRAETVESYRERILRVLIYIQNHLDEAISLDSLAEVANFSPFHFHRMFTGMVGESVKAHVRRLRLERAALQLLSSRQSILEIALGAGYETHETFTRAFSAMFGDSPSVFRKNHSIKALGKSPSGVHFSPDGNPEFQPVQEGRSSMEVEIKKVNKMRVAFIRHIGPYDQAGSAWQKIMSWAGKKGLAGPDVKFFGLSYDDPDITPPDKLRYDAAVEVPENVEAEGEVGIQDIESGDYAVTVHRGSYQNFNKTYTRLFSEWLPSSGREARKGPSLEFCLNSPQETPPEELLSEIYIPLV